MAQITISCLCGAARQTLTLKELRGGGGGRPHWPEISLCHCDTCRHLTGMLCTSYTPISSTTPPSLTNLERYSSSALVSRYFCATCGCHVFRSKGEAWEVATGVITKSPDLDLHGSPAWRHLHVNDTKDGGLAKWLPPAPEIKPTQPSPRGDTLPASCHCTLISLAITRPNSSSVLPHSNFPDLMLPYCRTAESVVSNPSSVKWWLQPPPTHTIPVGSQPPIPTTPQNNPISPQCSPNQDDHPTPDEDFSQHRYLAGTCACRPCRLASGFEIQSWVFIPRGNILIHPPADNSIHSSATADLPIDKTTSPIPLGFDTISPTLLASYNSSPSATRHFCPRCGATVFWRNQARPDLIDVSTGLLRAPEGSRAETWLEWWTGRVSFSEDARNERTGAAVCWAESLVKELEGGMVSGSH
ncbi:Mss4-like protein [Lasiosphaeria hispida]|uniref:Mss4-like protein n=1 Tax=Lasiosphaeria hispida TaxID=260671 RepID=A0AAJ0HXF7_9PEZI|nr:Mss4-like protein [Lasiosphaeria hispida]